MGRSRDDGSLSKEMKLGIIVCVVMPLMIYCINKYWDYVERKRVYPNRRNRDDVAREAAQAKADRKKKKA